MLYVPGDTSIQLADILLHVAALTVAVSGFLLTMRARRLAGRTFLLGCLLAALVVFTSVNTTTGESGLGDTVARCVVGWLTLAAFGGLVLRLHPRIVFGLAVIPVFTMAEPLVRTWFDALPFWASTLVYAAISLIALQAFVTILFGRDVAGHFTGVMLVRLFDFLIFGPLRGLTGGVHLMRRW